MFDPALAAAAHSHITQVDNITDLFRAHYGPHTSVAETFRDFTVGLGVAEACDGEIIAVDGRVWRVPADGHPVEAAASLGLPFAVVARGGAPVEVPVAAGCTMEGIAAAVADVITVGSGGRPAAHLVAAVRLDGRFMDVVLRSEHRQEPPYPPLPDVLSREVRFAFPRWQGTLAGFRFPDLRDGVAVPGLHLHGIASDHASGGHCHSFVVADAMLTVWLGDAEVILPHDGLAQQGRTEASDQPT